MTHDQRCVCPVTTIRPAKAKDALRIGDIFVTSRQVALPFIKEPHSPKDMIAWISNTVVPRSSTWVICIGDLIAGFMTFDQSRIEHLYL